MSAANRQRSTSHCHVSKVKDSQLFCDSCTATVKEIIILIHMIFLVFQILIMTLLFIVTNLLTFFFHGVHLEGWAEGLGRLFIPEVCSVKSLN